VKLVGFGGLDEDAVDVLHGVVPLSFVCKYIIAQGGMKVNRKMEFLFVKSLLSTFNKHLTLLMTGIARLMY
jgi:hypothetical protein